MASRVDLTIGIRADTEQAKKDLRSLQQTLTDLVTMKGQTDPLKEFKASTNELRRELGTLYSELGQATNDKGVLNINKLAVMWKESGKSIEYYRDRLEKLGPEGQKAFLQLTTAISRAQEPVRELDGLLGKFTKGLMNTAMWTLQSNAIHAFQSALSGAFSYAERLNKGLTDIAIVSDLTGSKLADFAKTANQMARELSTSTNEVVSGALIYYQAGLSDEEVINRTETTIKLAQTSGESAEQISSYMTSIWNNFYDGSKSVEYYADAISYLGAVTAASNADIAEGLQSFAATAETVGLSFEYAASAMTVIRDVTQQSASTIGNSLKTIFARLSNIKSGTNEEDDVDLTKYTKELAKYGVEVLDANGELKEMDQILDDLAKKWQTLSKTQQTSIAQTVGGVRQYNNLITLMDNYERFQELVSGAKNSTGYLDKQSNIYAESWEAATNRVRAAVERLYQVLINDKFIISLTNGFAKILEFIGAILEKSGGFSTIFPMLISWISKGINDNLAITNNRVKEILNNTIHFKEYSEMGRQLRGSATSEQLSPNFAYDIVNEDWQNELNGGYSEYLSMIKKLEELRAQGAPDSMLVEYELQAKQLLTVLEKVHQSYKDIEQEQAEALRKQTVDQADYLEQQAARSSGITLASTYKDAFNTAIPGIRKNAPKDQVLDAVFDNVPLPDLQKELENKFNAIKGTSSKDQIVQELNKVFDKYIQDKRDEIDAAYEKAVNEKLFEKEVPQSNKKGNKEKTPAGGLTQKDLDILKKGNDGSKEYQETLEKTKEKTKELTEAAKRQGEQWGQNSSAIDEVKMQTAEMTTEMGKQERVIKSLNDQWQVQLGYIVSAASSITALASAFSSFIKGTEKFKEGDFSGGLKQMGSSALMMATNISMLTNTIGRSSALQNLIIGLSSGKISTGITTLANKSEAISGFFAKTAIEGKAGALAVGQIASALGTVALIVGAIAVTARVIYTIWKNTSSTALHNDLSKSVEENNEKVKELRSEYEKLQDTLSSLDSKKGRIEQLTTGTQEWKNAVHELNNEINDLVKKYNLKLGEDFTINNGVFEITEKGKEKINQQSEADIAQVSNAAFASDMVLKTGDYIEKVQGIQAALQQYLFEAGLSENEGITNSVNNITSLGEALQWINDLDLSESTISADEWDNIKQRWINGMSQGTDDFYQAENDLYLAILEKVATERPDLNDEAAGNAAKNIFTAIIQAILNGEADITEKQFKDYLEKNGFKRNRLGKYSNDTEKGITRQVLWERAKSDYFWNSQNGFVQNAINGEVARIPIAKNDYDRGDESLSKKEKENVEQYATALKELQPELYAFNRSEKEANALAREIAVRYYNFNKGLKDLKENYATYIPLLRQGNKLSGDYTEALGNVRDALSLMLDIDPSSLSQKFFENTKALDAMEKAAQGDVAALQELTEIAAQDLFDQGMTIFGENPDEQIQSLYNEISEMIANSEQWNDLEVGAELTLHDDGGFINKLNEMLENAYAISNEAGEAMYQAIQGAFNAIQFEPQIEMVPESISTHGQTFAEGYFQSGFGGASGFQGGSGALADFASAYSSEMQRWSGQADVSASTDVYFPHIKGATSTGPVGKKTGLSTPKGSKGGGSKKKDKEKGTNRYHEITEQIGQTKHALEMLNDEEDRAYGQKKLDLIKEKIKLLEKEAQQYQQLYDEAKDYNASDRALLASQYGAKFNKDGTIKDYQEWYDSFVDRYNSGAMDDDAWKAFEDAIKKYEESYKKMNEAEKAYQDLMNQVYDARLAAIEHKLSFLNKEIDEANKHIDFLIEQMSKDIYQLADAMAEMSKQAGNLLNKASNYRQAIIDMFAGKNHEGVSKSMIKGFLNGTVSVGELIEAAGDLTDKEIDMLYEYAAALEEISQQLIELREKQYETLGKVIDGFNEKIERQSDIISDATEILKHYRNVVDIVGKDILGMSDELLKQLSRTAVEGAKANLAVAKLQLDQNKQILEQMRQSLNDQIAAGASEEAIRLMEQAIEDQEDRVREMSENWASAWENALQTAQEAFTDAVKIATDAFSQAVSGSMGNIENLQDMYEKQNTLNDLYLPKYQQIYELNKLTRDVNNAIDNTDNIAGKERLLALQRDINDAMQEGSKVTEYDVGFMQRRLELEMALIALEEAQNAKNQVRMTRDSEGNWSYTYTADAQKVAEAQQNYEDKLYELEKYNQDHVKELQGQMISAFNDYKNEIESLTTLDGEQKAKLLEDYWTQLQNEYGVFLDKALSDGQFIVDTYDAYSHELMTSFSDTILSQVTGFQTLEDMMASFAKASEYMMQLVSDAYSDWDGDWHSIFEIAGVDAENFSGEVSEAMADFGETMDTAVEEAQRFADELGEQFDAALDNLEDFIDKYDKKIQKLIDKNKEAVESILEFIYEYDRLHAKDEEKEKEKEKPTTPTEPTGPSGSDTGTGPGGSPPVSGPPDPRQGQHGITKDGEGYKDLNDQKHIHWIRWTSPLKGTWTDEQQEAHSFGDAYVENSYWYVQCSKCNYKKKLPGGGGLRPVYQMLSSGGYTGAWGPSGKFAMLHEKELVLNKHDTENMLKAVGFVRDLTQMISLNASVANQGLGNLFLGGVSQGGGFLDQTVTIHAEFPNATNHTEIEEAFSNLIGLASQYAGRKK